MARTRIYQSLDLQPHTTLVLDEKASHHLARVLRAAIGDTLFVFNGDGHDYAAIISHIDKKRVTVILADKVLRQTEPALHIMLAQGIARGEKMDFIVQKAVELGVSEIFPLVTERGNVRLDHERTDKRLQHWESVMMSACEQSGRACLPRIHTPENYMTWLASVSADLAFVLTPHVTDKLTQTQLAPSARVLLLIGPEGGLSQREIDAAQQNGFKPLNLGPRVLRTETATIAALSTIQARFGDFL